MVIWLYKSHSHYVFFQELVGDLAPKLEFPDSVVSNTGIQSKQQTIACLALEQKLQAHDAESQEPKSKRRRTSVRQVQPDDNVEVWTELARSVALIECGCLISVLLCEF